MTVNKNVRWVYVGNLIAMLAILLAVAVDDASARNIETPPSSVSSEALAFSKGVYWGCRHTSIVHSTQECLRVTNAAISNHIYYRYYR